MLTQQKKAFGKFFFCISEVFDCDGCEWLVGIQKGLELKCFWSSNSLKVI